MLKKILTFIFLLSSLNFFGQDINELRKKAANSSQSELTGFINNAKKQGLKLSDAEKQLILIGGKAEEIKMLRELWNKNVTEESIGPIETDTKDKISSKFGSTEGFKKDSISTEEIENKLKRFGSDFFSNQNITESPQLFVATPTDYRLGPGDELIINLYGASENTYTVQISRNGSVKFERLAPVYLSGLSIISATNRLKDRLSKLYTGLNSDNPVEKVYLELSLQKARSIVVNITGSVVAPGTYTISAFSSVLNALYAAGGPNEIGSYRNINILRNGRLIQNIDLYNYFVDGIYPTIYLRDQDVIMVNSYQIQTELVTGFKQTALFELKDDEVISDLLRFSGGTSSNAFKNKVFIERYDEFSKRIKEVDQSDFITTNLHDGDKVFFKEIDEDNITGTVKIGGAVYLEGKYELDKNKSVGELLKSAQGVTRNRLGVSAILFRNNFGLENESITLDLNNSDDLSLTLFENDSLYVPSTKDILFDQKIEVKGEVNFPKEIDFKYGITITDLIVLSGGLTPYANKKDVRIFRNISRDGNDDITQEIIIELDDNLIPNKDLSLLPDDIVTVNTYPYRKSNEFFRIIGEVALPGLYSIKNQNYTVFDAFKDNIEFLSSSSIDGISILRDSIQIPLEGLKLLSQGPKSKYNFRLFSGDEIIVPKIDNTVFVSGAVQQEGIINVSKQISSRAAVQAVGGFNSSSVRRKLYVEYQNGLKKTTKNFLIFNIYPRALPGSKIIVPKKNDEEKSGISVSEIVGFTTSLVSIFAIIKSI